MQTGQMNKLNIIVYDHAAEYNRKDINDKLLNIIDSLRLCGYEPFNVYLISKYNYAAVKYKLSRVVINCRNRSQFAGILNALSSCHKFPVFICNVRTKPPFIPADLSANYLFKLSDNPPFHKFSATHTDNLVREFFYIGSPTEISFNSVAADVLFIKEVGRFLDIVKGEISLERAIAKSVKPANILSDRPRFEFKLAKLVYGEYVEPLPAKHSRTDDEENKIVELFLSGRTRNEIATAVSLPYSTICHFVRRIHKPADAA